MIVNRANYMRVRHDYVLLMSYDELFFLNLKTSMYVTLKVPILRSQSKLIRYSKPFFLTVFLISFSRKRRNRTRRNGFWKNSGFCRSDPSVTSGEPTEIFRSDSHTDQRTRLPDIRAVRSLRLVHLLGFLVLVGCVYQRVGLPGRMGWV